jgi:hypothetical protein
VIQAALKAAQTSNDLLLLAASEAVSAAVGLNGNNGNQWGKWQRMAPLTALSTSTKRSEELVRLSKEQGYLTYNDINDRASENIISPMISTKFYTQLHNLDVEIVDQAEVDVVKQPEQEEEDKQETPRCAWISSTIQSGCISSRWARFPCSRANRKSRFANASRKLRTRFKAIIYSFGFTGKEHIALAEKLISEPPKERFDRVIVDKKVDSRDAHLKELRRLVKNVASWTRMSTRPTSLASRCDHRQKRNAQAHFQKADHAFNAPSRILLQTEGPRGNGACRRQHPRQNPASLKSIQEF